jgi:cytochrome c oxidase subunit 1
MFTWSILVSGAVMLLALPVLIGAFGLLFVDRHYGASVFSGFTGSRGGNPLLWPRLFWFGAYPLLWALLIPALGAVSDILATFAGRRLFSRDRAMAALGAVGVLSFAGWGSEVTNLVTARALFVVGALAVLAPVASLILNWLITLRAGLRGPDAVDAGTEGLGATPMLWALGFVVVLALGLAGSVVSALDATRSAHSNYWQVAQQHGLFFGAASIGAVAALSFWGPKLWGYRLSDALGKLELLAVVGGTLLTVLGMFVLGAQDFAVHSPTFSSSDDFGPANLIVSAGAAIVGLGLLVLLFDLFVTQVGGRGRRAGADPWGGQSLEWATTSPPPLHNFDALPEIRSDTPLLDLRIGRSSGPAPEPDPDLTESPAS